MPGLIAVIGSINTDLVTTTERWPEAGETVLAQDFRQLPGGKGANQAVAAARLGGRVAMVGRVGEDAWGLAARASLAAAGVDTAHVRTSLGVSSGVATIVVDAHGENRILLAAGANAHVTPADVEARLLADSALVVLQLEIPVETVYGVIAGCGQALLNPAPAVPLDLERLRGLGYLVPNQGELASLTGLPTTRMDDVVAASRRLVRLGIRCVITTLGPDGALLVTSTRVAHVAAPAVTPVDTTGAGDAFIGCFAQTLVETGDVDRALARAVRYASLSVTRRGAQASYVDAAAFARLMPDPHDDGRTHGER